MYIIYHYETDGKLEGMGVVNKSIKYIMFYFEELLKLLTYLFW